MWSSRQIPDRDRKAGPERRSPTVTRHLVRWGPRPSAYRPLRMPVVLAACTALATLSTGPMLARAWPGAAAPNETSNAAASRAVAPTAAVVGTVDTMAGDVTASLGSGLATPHLVFRSSTGAVLASVAGQPVRVVAGSWAPLTPIVAVAPQGTARATPTVAWSGLLFGARTRDTSVTSHPVTAPAVAGPLHVVGNHIVDATGHDLVLRGVDLVDMLSAAGASQVTEQVVAGIRSWGATLVRVSLGEQLLLPTGCAYDPAYLAQLQRVVRWITDLGMVALLDLHESQPYCLFPAGDQDMADAPGSVQFWHEVAGTFAGNPLVAFDLYNEPHAIPDSTWLSGGMAVAWLPYQAAGMQQLYDAVRSAGASNLVFVSGNDWATEPPPVLLNGYNVVYSVHDYTCPTNAPPNCTSPAPYDPNPILAAWTALGSRVPVFVGEFGWPSTTNGTYDQAVIDAAGTRGWGWDAFSWTAGKFGILATAGATPEPDPSGMPVLAAMSGA